MSSGEPLTGAERMQYAPGVWNLAGEAFNVAAPTLYNPNYDRDAFFYGRRPQPKDVLPGLASLPEQPPPMMPPSGGQPGGGQPSGGQTPPSGGQVPPGGQMPPGAFMPMFTAPTIHVNPEMQWADDYYQRLGRRDDFTMGELERANRLREKRFDTMQGDIRNMHQALLSDFRQPVFEQQADVFPERNRAARISRERMRAQLFQMMRAGMSPQQAVQAVQAMGATGGAGYGPYSDNQYAALAGGDAAQYMLNRGQLALNTAGQFAQASLPYHQLYSQPLLPPDPMAEYGVSKRFTQQITAGENEGSRQFAAMMAQPQAALWSQGMNLQAIQNQLAQQQADQMRRFNWAREVANNPNMSEEMRNQARQALFAMITQQPGYGMPMQQPAQ